jgi:hypothetical protein
LGLGVHAVPRATLTTATITRADTRETEVAIEADVTNPRPQDRGGAQRKPRIADKVREQPVQNVVFDAG